MTHRFSTRNTFQILVLDLVAVICTRLCRSQQLLRQQLVHGELVPCSDDRGAYAAETATSNGKSDEGHQPDGNPNNPSHTVAKNKLRNEVMRLPTDFCSQNGCLSLTLARSSRRRSHHSRSFHQNNHCSTIDCLFRPGTNRSFRTRLPKYDTGNIIQSPRRLGPKDVSRGAR